MKISVVTISFNQGKFLRDAINSVFNQSYKNIEYIIIDAGSTDGSRDIINEYKEKFSRVIFEKDKGPADGLNKGLFLCTGDIFCYMNADDRFVPGAFEFAVNYYKNHPTIDGVIGAASVIDEVGKRKRRRILSGPYNMKTVLSGTALALQQATFLNLSSLRKWNISFNTENTTAWDAELLIDLCINGGAIKTVEKTLGEFRVYQGSITGSQRLQKKHEEDHSRLKSKLKRHGYHLSDGWSLKKLIFRFNPFQKLKGYLQLF